LIISWWRQLLPYTLAVISLKSVVLLPLLLPGISTSLFHFAQALLGFLSPSVQVIFVMAIFPVVMNVFQFCVVDQIIKAGRDELGRGNSPAPDYDLVPLEDEESFVPRTAPMLGHPSPVLRRTSSLAGGSRPNSPGSLGSKDAEGMERLANGMDT
jgi:hypothetical protein